MKQIWKISIRTRSCYVRHLMPLDLISLLSIRFLKFQHSCMSSVNPLVNFISNLSIRDTAWRNLSFISDHFDIPLPNLSVLCNKDFVNKMIHCIKQKNDLPENDFSCACFIAEVCQFRDGLINISSLTYDDIPFLLSFFTL